MIYKGMFNLMGCPRPQFEALAKFMNMDWKIYPGNQPFNKIPKENKKYVFIKLWRDMREKLNFY